MPDQLPDTRIEPQDSNYPAGIVQLLGRKAPRLHLRGNVRLLGVPGIGFCGSRKATGKGIDAAADCAEQAAQFGFTVISGNAGGVDLAAHRSALESGGSTILVLPEGLEHFSIRKDLKAVWDWDRVLVISQFEPKAIWQAYRAMARNEVIIGLSQAMIVIEAGATGGTLSAGLSTLSAGKPLFVAVYERTEETAPGNAHLLGRGGLPLSKSRSTGRANLDRVRLAAEKKMPVVGSAQHALW